MRARSQISALSASFLARDSVVVLALMEVDAEGSDTGSRSVARYDWLVEVTMPSLVNSVSRSITSGKISACSAS